MQHVITFDTLAFSKKLESSGMQTKQAETIAEAMKSILDENVSPQIFTKKDGHALKTKIENKFEILDSKFDAKISNLKTELITWMIGLLIAQSALLLSIIKFTH